MLKNLFFLHNVRSDIKPCMSIYIHFCQTANCNTFLSASLDKKIWKEKIKSTRWDYLIWFNQTLRLDVMHNIFYIYAAETREINLWPSLCFCLLFLQWFPFSSVDRQWHKFMRAVKVNLLYNKFRFFFLFNELILYSTVLNFYFRRFFFEEEIRVYGYWLFCITCYWL